MESANATYSAEQIEALLRCAVCLDKLKEPKILPCQHTLCLSPCLSGLVDRGSRIIRCPECRADHVIPRGGVQNFPTNLTVRNILDLSPRELDRFTSKCPLCDCQSELSKCLHCNKRLCDQCRLSHCRQMKHEINRMVNQLRRKIPKVSESIGETEQKVQDNRMKCEMIKHEISSGIEKHVNELRNRQKGLENEIDIFIQSEERSLHLHQENLEAQLASIASFSESVESTLQNSEHMYDMELVELGQQCSYQADQLRLLEETQVPVTGEVRFAENASNLTQILMNYGKLTIQSNGVVRNAQNNQANYRRREGAFHESINDSTLDPYQNVSRSRNGWDKVSPFSFVPFAGNRAPRQNSQPSPRQNGHNSNSSPRQNGHNSSPRQNAQSAVTPRSTSPVANNSWNWDDQVAQPRPQEPAEQPAQAAGGFTSFDIPRSRHARRRPRNVGQGRNRERNRNNQNQRNQDQSSVPSAPPGIQRSDTYVMERSDANSLTVTRSRNQYETKTNAQVIGSRGNEINKFTWPRGVAVFKDVNTVAVADSSNHRVQIFDSDGRYISSFGSYGQGEGEFDCLAGICVSGSNRIIISDRYNHRIQVFNRQGTFIRQFGQNGTGDGEFAYPWGVACDDSEKIYVCDKENHRIQVFDKDGNFLRKFGKLGKRDGEFSNPHYLTVTPHKALVISDNGNHRIQVFDLRGGHLLSFGREGIQNGQLKYPRGIAVDKQGFILAADGGNNRIQVFRQDGRYFCSFATHGKNAGQVKGVEGIAVMNNGKVVVCDRENHRIQIF